MRRPRPSPTPQGPTVSRALEYKGYQIAKMSDGSFRLYPSYEAVLDNSNWTEIENPENGRNKVDEKERPQRPVRPRRTTLDNSENVYAGQPKTEFIKEAVEELTRAARPMRQRRPAPKPTKEEYPRGGCMKNPPERCKYRYKFEPDGAYWVDNPNCAFNCSDPSCDTYNELMSEHKLRIARLNYKTPDSNCDHCNEKVKEKGLDHWTYECGSVYDRKEDKMTYSCKKPKRPTRPQRPTRPEPKDSEAHPNPTNGKEVQCPLEEAPAKPAVTINRRRR